MGANQGFEYTAPAPVIATVLAYALALDTALDRRWVQLRESADTALYQIAYCTCVSAKYTSVSMRRATIRPKNGEAELALWAGQCRYCETVYWCRRVSD